MATSDTSDTPDSTPQSIEMQAIEISDDLGSYTITLQSLANCLWHGPFQTGKLSVYLGDVSGTTSVPIIALVYVWTDPTQQELDSIGYVCYPIDTDLKAAVSASLEMLDAHYISRTMDQKEQRLQDGTATLQ